MKRNLISLQRFAESAFAIGLDGEERPLESKSPTALFRAQTATADLANSTGRIIRYKFSDETIGRDNHIVRNAGWVLDAFLKNPVFLWAHDMGQPPIGRVLEIGINGNALAGSVEYATKEQYPFADVCFELVRGQFLNAVSASWRPLEWKFSQDPKRMGGIDFIRQELLEISQAPVPVLPTALAQARAAGIDLKPVAEWAAKLLDEKNEALGTRAELEAVHRAASGEPKTIVQKPKAPMIRGMWQIADLALALNTLGYVEDSCRFEAEYEGDESEIPDRIHEALAALGQCLIDMTVEEVAELLGEPEEEGNVETEARTPGQRAMLMLTRAGAKSKDRWVIECDKPLSKATALRVQDVVRNWVETGKPIVLDSGLRIRNLRADHAPPTPTGKIDPFKLFEMKDAELLQLRAEGRIKLHPCAEGLGYIEILDKPIAAPDRTIAEKEARERRLRTIEISAA